MARVKNRPKKKGPRRFAMGNRRKLLITFLVMVIMMVSLIGRLTYISLTSNEKYQKQVLSQLNYNSSVIPYRRGDITDRNGVVLATSEKVYNLIIDPYVMTHSKVNKEGDCVDTTLEVLEKYFGLDEDEVEAVVESNPENRYRVMKKQLTYAQLQPYYEFMNSEDEEDKEISKYVKGIWFEDDYVRRYPYNTLACDLLGFTASGNVGTWGVEQYYNDTLNGTDGREYGYLTEETDLERTTVLPVNGNNVTTTIDINIQRVVEKHIWEFNEAIGSKNTAVIVMDPDTGEILAMASYPVYNLNDPRDLTGIYTDEEIKEMTSEIKLEILNELWRNFCISDPYEPGSTAKTMTVSEALDEFVTVSSNVFLCDGAEEFADGDGTMQVKCNSVHGELDLTGSLMESCNDAMMELASRLGISTFTKYQTKFNLGQYTNIDLPGESSAEGLIYYESNMGPVELATSSFGQGYVCTAIQMVSAFSSIINGGNYYQPHVVKQITTESGSVVENKESVLMRTTISEETSQWMRDAMWQTVGKIGEDGTLIQGTAYDAYIEGYDIGGKTGTAEKKPIEEGRCTASLISFAPVDDPEVVVYVVIDEPNTVNQGDSHLAQIMSRKIYEEILPYMQIFSADEPGYVAPESIEPESFEPEQETVLETEETIAESEGTTESGQEESTEETAESEKENFVVEDEDDFAWPKLTEQRISELRYEYLYNRIKPNEVAVDKSVKAEDTDIE